MNHLIRGACALVVIGCFASCGGDDDDDVVVDSGGSIDAATTGDGGTTPDSATAVDASSSVDPYVQCNVTVTPVVACDITNGVACDELFASGSMCSGGTTSPVRCPTMKGTKKLVGICVTSNGNMNRFSYAEPAVQTQAANSANTGCLTSPGYQRFCRLVP